MLQSWPQLHINRNQYVPNPVIRSGNLKSLNQLINTTLMGSGNTARGVVGSGYVSKAILKHNLPFSFRAFGESVMGDVALIAASEFGPSSRLSFMQPSCTLIWVMLTRKMRGASQAGSLHMIVVAEDTGLNNSIWLGRPAPGPL